jgi:hypothetical protein
MLHGEEELWRKSEDYRSETKGKSRRAQRKIEEDLKPK